MAVISEDVEIIARICDRLRDLRKTDIIYEDMFEAADDWRILGRELRTADPWVDLRFLARQNEEQWESMQTAYGERLKQDPDLVTVMEIGARLIEEGKKRQPDPKGRLGSNEIIAEQFGFLVIDHKFNRRENDLGARSYDRNGLAIVVEFPVATLPPCTLEHQSFPNKTCTIDDVLFRAGKLPSIIPQPVPAPTTEAEVQALFSAIADTLRTDASDLLADKPGAFASLVTASEERDRLFGAECDRLYELENGPPTVWSDVDDPV